jgi:hypothetical protein
MTLTTRINSIITKAIFLIMPLERLFQLDYLYCAAALIDLYEVNTSPQYPVLIVPTTPGDA